MADILLDLTLFKGFEADISLGGFVIEGGRPVTGAPPVENDITGGGFWRITYSRIVIGSAAQHRGWLALIAHLSVAGNRLTVEILNEPNRPAGFAGVIYGAFDVHETTIDIDISGGAISAGDIISINHGGAFAHRSYIVSAIDSIVSTVYTIGITPPLRTDVADLATVTTSAPKVMMRRAPGFVPAWSPSGRYTADQHLDLIEAGW